MNTQTKTKDDQDGAKRQAIAQFQSIAEMVSRLRKAEKKNDDDKREEARRAIEEDALSVQVRSGWYSPGDTAGAKPAEFEILLCTGGPAVRIIGELSEYMEPESARIEYQDWFTPWTEWRAASPDNVQKIVLEYCRVFYFGE